MKKISLLALLLGISALLGVAQTTSLNGPVVKMQVYGSWTIPKTISYLPRYNPEYLEGMRIS